MSFGVACYREDDGTSFERALERADSALYRAKGAGRNQVAAEADDATAAAA